MRLTVPTQISRSWAKHRPAPARPSIQPNLDFLVSQFPTGGKDKSHFLLSVLSGRESVGAFRLARARDILLFQLLKLPWAGDGPGGGALNSLRAPPLRLQGASAGAGLVRMQCRPAPAWCARRRAAGVVRTTPGPWFTIWPGTPAHPAANALPGALVRSHARRKASPRPRPWVGRMRISHPKRTMSPDAPLGCLIGQPAPRRRSTGQEVSSPVGGPCNWG